MSNTEIFGQEVDEVYEYMVDDIPVYSSIEIAEEDLLSDVQSQIKRIKMKPDYIVLREVDGWLEGKPMLGNPPHFERIRRITGYLVGTLDRFNDAKRAEESERVKHHV